MCRHRVMLVLAYQARAHRHRPMPMPTRAPKRKSQHPRSRPTAHGARRNSTMPPWPPASRPPCSNRRTSSPPRDPWSACWHGAAPTRRRSHGCRCAACVSSRAARWSMRAATASRAAAARTWPSRSGPFARPGRRRRARPK
nr:hypothetical protein [Variovorax sp. E3]